jgi:hypothetical protein
VAVKIVFSLLTTFPLLRSVILTNTMKGKTKRQSSFFFGAFVDVGTAGSGQSATLGAWHEGDRNTHKEAFSLKKCGREEAERRRA